MAAPFYTCTSANPLYMQKYSHRWLTEKCVRDAHKSVQVLMLCVIGNTHVSTGLLHNTSINFDPLPRSACFKSFLPLIGMECGSHEK